MPTPGTSSTTRSPIRPCSAAVGEDGVQLRWLAPTEQYVELGVEVGRGRSFPGGGNNRNGAGMAALIAHTGGDIGASHSWRAGLSDPAGQRRTIGAVIGLDPSGATVTNAFSGDTTRLDRQRGLEMGAERECQRNQLRASTGSTCAASATAASSTTSANPDSVDPTTQRIRLVRARRLPVYAPMARGLRTERLYAGTADAACTRQLRRQRLRPRARTR